MSFADDTRLYHGISNVDDCSFLHHDLNSVYDWTYCNNMSFNAQKFQYICLSPHSSSSSNVYTSSSFDIINYSKNILDLGINVSNDCSIDFHISNLTVLKLYSLQRRREIYYYLYVEHFGGSGP